MAAQYVWRYVDHGSTIKLELKWSMCIFLVCVFIIHILFMVIIVIHMQPWCRFEFSFEFDNSQFDYGEFGYGQSFGRLDAFAGMIITGVNFFFTFTHGFNI